MHRCAVPPGSAQPRGRSQLGLGPGVGHDQRLRHQHYRRHHQQRPDDDEGQRVAPLAAAPTLIGPVHTNEIRRPKGLTSRRCLESTSAERPERGSAALELLVVAPVMALLALFVLWAAETGRARLVILLAAEEAAVAAVVVCYADPSAGVTDQQQDACEEAVVADVLSARPAVAQLCVAGPSPTADPSAVSLQAGTAGGFVARQGAVLTVGVACVPHGPFAPFDSTVATTEFQAHAVHLADTSP